MRKSFYNTSKRVCVGGGVQPVLNPMLSAQSTVAKDPAWGSITTSLRNAGVAMPKWCCHIELNHWWLHAGMSPFAGNSYPPMTSQDRSSPATPTTPAFMTSPGTTGPTPCVATRTHIQSHYIHNSTHTITRHHVHTPVSLQAHESLTRAHTRINTFPNHSERLYTGKIVHPLINTPTNISHIEIVTSGVPVIIRSPGSMVKCVEMATSSSGTSVVMSHNAKAKTAYHTTVSMMNGKD